MSSKGGESVGPSPVDHGRAGSKHHLATDGIGIPLAVILTGGNIHDSAQLFSLLDAIPVIRGKPGNPFTRPRWLYADHAYDSDSPSCEAPEPRNRLENRHRNTEYGSRIGEHRWGVERDFAWLCAFKRLRGRYERQVKTHYGFLKLACILISQRKLQNLILK
ncbi:IS5 family transposase [Sciscionella marina]|uniref:IS5 family transposase n=1 Tax=Sciscionella marina TaxID=508770 RepID=UPI000A05E91B|nr:IS5 family transposase [Sciscionella marina]